MEELQGNICLCPGFQEKVEEGVHLDAVREGERVHAWFAFVRPRKLREGDIEWLLQIWADQCLTSNIPGTCPQPLLPHPYSPHSWHSNSSSVRAILRQDLLTLYDGRVAEA